MKKVFSFGDNVQIFLNGSWHQGVIISWYQQKVMTNDNVGEEYKYCVRVNPEHGCPFDEYASSDILRYNNEIDYLSIANFLDFHRYEFAQEFYDGNEEESDKQISLLFDLAKKYCETRYLSHN